jgi:hypothetical protein
VTETDLGGVTASWQNKIVRLRIAARHEGISMKTYILSGLAALALAVGVSPATAQDIEFTLINDSSQTLHYFYAAPSNTSDWGDDLLGETGTLEPGYQATTFIYDGSDQCLYDFRFETAEGGLLEAWEVDICTLGSYTLTD